MGKLVFWGILIGHVSGYKEYFIRIIRCFGVTCVIKKILKASGEGTKADMVALGGYSMTGSEVVNYMAATLRSGSWKIENRTEEEIVKGLFPTLWESVKEGLLKEEVKEGIMEGIKAGFGDNKNKSKGINGGIW